MKHWGVTEWISDQRKIVKKGAEKNATETQDKKLRGKYTMFFMFLFLSDNESRVQRQNSHQTPYMHSRFWANKAQYVYTFDKQRALVVTHDYQRWRLKPRITSSNYVNTHILGSVARGTTMWAFTFLTNSLHVTDVPQWVARGQRDRKETLTIISDRAYNLPERSCTVKPLEAVTLS